METFESDVILWSGPATLFDSGSRRVGELFLTSDELFFISLVSGETVSSSSLSWVALLGPLGLLIGRMQKRRDQEAFNTLLADIDDTPGAMSLDARFSCSPGSVRATYAQIEASSKTWRGRLRIETSLGGRYELDMKDAAAVAVKLARLVDDARASSERLDALLIDGDE